MIGALYILAFLIIVGLVLYAFECRHRRHAATAAPAEPDATPTPPADEADGESECCGMHIVCEKDTLIPFTTEADYYDDEELDRFAGRAADDYTDEEVAGWAGSISLRGITLPAIVKEELLLLVAERRAALTSHSAAG